MKRLVALALCLCLLLCGCKGGDGYTPTGDGLSYDENYTGPHNAPPTQDNAQQLTLPYYEARSLNPYLCTDYTNRALFSLLYQGLFSVNREYVAEPQLAGRYLISEDNKTYTVYLQSATFSDGTTLTPNDVIASYTSAKESAYYKGRFLHITDFVAGADGAITFHLDTPIEPDYFPLLLDIPIVKADQVALDRPVGTGPYRISSSVDGEILQQRSDWWCSATLPISAETIGLYAAESTIGIRDQFEFFDLSMVCADPGSDRYADYRCDYELWDFENGIFLYLATSANSKVFSNDAVRIALTYAIDRDSITEEFYRGFARSATLPASPLSPFYSQNLAERYAFDGVKFAQAVKDNGMEGEKVVFLVNAEDSLRLRVARRIEDMLEDCGLDVELQEKTGNSYVDALKSWNYDIYLGQTRLSPNMDLSAFFATWGELSWGGVNDLGAYALSLQALENHGNYFTLHKLVMDQGLLCPILFRSYAVYAERGLISSLTPARDNMFYYSLGKTIADIGE